MSNFIFIHFFPGEDLSWVKSSCGIWTLWTDVNKVPVPRCVRTGSWPMSTSFRPLQPLLDWFWGPWQQHHHDAVLIWDQHDQLTHVRYCVETSGCPGMNCWLVLSRWTLLKKVLVENEPDVPVRVPAPGRASAVPVGSRDSWNPNVSVLLPSARNVQVDVSRLHFCGMRTNWVRSHWWD